MTGFQAQGVKWLWSRIKTAYATIIWSQFANSCSLIYHKKYSFFPKKVPVLTRKSELSMVDEKAGRFKQSNKQFYSFFEMSPEFPLLVSFHHHHHIFRETKWKYTRSLLFTRILEFTMTAKKRSLLSLNPSSAIFVPVIISRIIILNYASYRTYTNMITLKKSWSWPIGTVSKSSD